MYSIVMLAAMTARPRRTSRLVVSSYSFEVRTRSLVQIQFLRLLFPARYGSVNCWNKGFGVLPRRGRGFGGHCGCSVELRLLLHPGPCACSCAPNYGTGGGGGGCNYCGHGWSVGDNQPAYYTSVLGCPPHVSAPPYACYTEKNPCCKYGQFAFDTGLIGHSHGVGYAGFGGYGNFGHYGGVSMIHKPTSQDLPPFPNPEYRIPSSMPTTPAPMPPLPTGKIAPPGSTLPPLPTEKIIPPGINIPPVPELPSAPAPAPEPSKKLQTGRPISATVVLCVPERAIITVDGQPLHSSGRERTFRTPALALEEDFVYTVQATVMVNGNPETETLKVNVVAGQVSRASFEKLFAKLDGPRPSIVTTGLQK